MINSSVYVYAALMDVWEPRGQQAYDCTSQPENCCECFWLGVQQVLQTTPAPEQGDYFCKLASTTSQTSGGSTCRNCSHNCCQDCREHYCFTLASSPPGTGLGLTTAAAPFCSTACAAGFTLAFRVKQFFVSIEGQQPEGNLWCTTLPGSSP